MTKALPRPVRSADLEIVDLSTAVREALYSSKWFIRDFDPVAALAVCEDVAGGATLEESCGPSRSRPTKSVFLRWCMRVPELGEVYKVAREIAAHVLEDEALGKARELFRMEKPDSARVSAYNVAMQQLRWSAGKRHPKEYSDKSQTTFTVPVTINTSIPLERGGELEESDPNAMFTIEAHAENAAETPPVEGDNPFAKMNAVVDEWRARGGVEKWRRQGNASRRQDSLELRADPEWQARSAEDKEAKREYWRQRMRKIRAERRAKRAAEKEAENAQQRDLARSGLPGVGGQQLAGPPEHLALEGGSGEALPGTGDGVRSGGLGDPDPHNDSLALGRERGGGRGLHPESGDSARSEALEGVSEGRKEPSAE